ncbi:hypothetical protein E5Q_02521 [Mixia osmundae IAM 14324]|uniref:HTH APSES-type domain-containing protein n=1 Tax=Mixia osmundae (strain CBS 9802 / IAM 14324 / JCM 22182 / KY 12970) TaxID=764103 RepID=G7DZ54_MIXOS|nr:hypothetical protein E5Q_02521 [Mixia osmundae IAM 14324]
MSGPSSRPAWSNRHYPQLPATFVRTIPPVERGNALLGTGRQPAARSAHQQNLEALSRGNSATKKAKSSTINPEVKMQRLDLPNGRQIRIARMKMPTPRDGTIHLIKRLDTDSISATTFFRAAFPTATDDELRNEACYLASIYNTEAYGLVGHEDALAGVWIPAWAARDVANFYGLGPQVNNLITFYPPGWQGPIHRIDSTTQLPIPAGTPRDAPPPTSSPNTSTSTPSRSALRKTTTIKLPVTSNLAGGQLELESSEAGGSPAPSSSPVPQTAAPQGILSRMNDDGKAGTPKSARTVRILSPPATTRSATRAQENAQEAPSPIPVLRLSPASDTTSSASLSGPLARPELQRDAFTSSTIAPPPSSIPASVPVPSKALQSSDVSVANVIHPTRRLRSQSPQQSAAAPAQSFAGAMATLSPASAVRSAAATSETLVPTNAAPSVPDETLVAGDDNLSRADTPRRDVRPDDVQVYYKTIPDPSGNGFKIATRLGLSPSASLTDFGQAPPDESDQPRPSKIARKTSLLGAEEFAQIGSAERVELEAAKAKELVAQLKKEGKFNQIPSRKRDAIEAVLDPDYKPQTEEIMVASRPKSRGGLFSFLLGQRRPPRIRATTVRRVSVGSTASANISSRPMKKLPRSASTASRSRSTSTDEQEMEGVQQTVQIIEAPLPVRQSTGNFFALAGVFALGAASVAVPYIL